MDKGGKMREIKFRAWDKANKRFTTLGIMFDIGCGLVVKPGWAKDGFGTIIPAPELELTQYTGIKDKNGKKIYEGDIVEYRYGDDSGGVSVIIYWNGCFEVDAGYVSCIGAMAEIEVSGNIYENPELLEKCG